MRNALIAAVLASLAACSVDDPKAASEANFVTALNQHYGDRPECVRAGKEADEDGMVAEIMASERSRDRSAPKLDALAAQGLLAIETVAVDVPNFTSGQTDMEEARRYRLTETGRAALRPEGQRSGFGRSASEFCYGRRDVVALTNFTEPADVMGVRATSVSYEYDLADVPDWAKAETVNRAFPEIAKALDGTKSDSDDLVLTKAGWVHHRDAP
jgi:hypothetical protein